MASEIFNIVMNGRGVEFLITYRVMNFSPRKKGELSGYFLTKRGKFRRIFRSPQVKPLIPPNRQEQLKDDLWTIYYYYSPAAQLRCLFTCLGPHA